jgi:hypothetical protein
MKNKIGIIGHVNHGATSSAAIERLKPNYAIVELPDDNITEALKHIYSEKERGIVIVSQPKKDQPKMIEINGTHYIESFQNDGLKILQMAENIWSEKKERKLNPSIDIVNEYRLIKNKQSKLSRWERDTVEKTFEHFYSPVK